MSIMRNDIPILEFDSDDKAVIMPTHEQLDIVLPEKCIFAFLGEYIDTYAKNNPCKKLSEFITITKTFPVYTTEYKGETKLLSSYAAARQKILLNNYASFDGKTLQPFQSVVIRIQG